LLMLHNVDVNSVIRRVNIEDRFEQDLDFKFFSLNFTSIFRTLDATSNHHVISYVIEIQGCRNKDLHRPSVGVQPTFLLRRKESVDTRAWNG
jgi:hypothetical protein